MKKSRITITDAETDEVYVDELTDCILGVCGVNGGVRHLISSSVSTELLATNLFMLKQMIDEMLEDVKLSTIVEGLEDTFNNDENEDEENESED